MVDDSTKGCPDLPALMGGAWWTFFLWLKAAILSLVLHLVFNPLCYWTTRCSKFLLACIVVLEDPLCHIQPHKAVKYDVRFSILFDCRIVLPFDFLRNPSLQCYWFRRRPYGKVHRTKLRSVPPGFYLRFRLQYRRLKVRHEDSPAIWRRSAPDLPGMLSSALSWSLSLLCGTFLSAPQGPATLAGGFPSLNSVHSMFAHGFTEPDIRNLNLTKLKPDPPLTLIDVLLHYDEPHLQFRRQQQQRQELLRLMRFETKEQDPTVSALVAAIELKEDLWPHRDVTPEDRQAVMYLTQGCSHGNMPIVLDTGASFSITPILKDFVTPIMTTSAESIKGIANSLNIKGVGKVAWPIRDVFGRTGTVLADAFYVPKAEVRLFSPQCLFREHQAGRCIIDHLKTILELPSGGHLEFPFNPGNNLPLMFLDDYEKVGLAQADLPTAGSALSGVLDIIAEENRNLTAAQKEVLMWHYRLGHPGIGWVQALMRKRKGEDGTEALPPIIPTAHEKAKSCDRPLCEACLLGKQHRRTPGVVTVKPKSEMEMAIRREHLHPGDCVSLDQYESSVRGRLLHTFGKEHTSERLVGGTIAVDHASGYVF